MSSYCDSNKKPTGNDRDKKISVQTGSNSNHSFGSYFTFQDNLNENDISQGNSHNDFESKSLLGSGDMANATVVKTRKPKCKDCDTLVPPRAKHCPICRHCVLKRDHHCFFVGCCIGYHNQRFFIIFCLYVGVGEIFNSAVTFLYLRRYNLEESTGWGYLVYILPVLFVLFFMGRVSESALGMTILLYWSVLTVLLCAHFFCVQVNLVYHGQTKYEYMKGIKTYQGSVWRNITSVFGRYWLVGFIVPVPFLGYQSDGADWRHAISDNKLV
ncbi:unnamed protein product [Candidula unifasciata]|uniref:Palmitoyltransferase n=1 Tax=Candidula unifasciata TaxID=100452 RepID=A0A8S3Z6L4_9EUPU|nr:unnamed protein product [Candidula unifasciata]